MVGEITFREDSVNNLMLSSHSGSSFFSPNLTSFSDFRKKQST